MTVLPKQSKKQIGVMYKEILNDLSTGLNGRASETKGYLVE